VVVCTLDMIPNGEFPSLPLFLAAGLFTVTREVSKPSREGRSIEPRPVVAAG
jgi:hypothetical protein